MVTTKWQKTVIIVGIFLSVSLMLAGCGAFSPMGANSQTGLRILSSSENQTLEPIIQDFAKRNNMSIKVTYLGSLEIMHELEKGAPDYDAVWVANGMWISLGDKQRVVKHTKSIMTSPVVFGIKDSVATKLGFKNRVVKMSEILAAINAKKFSFAMTSATQSNSGACAYIGFLQAMAGNPEVLTIDDLSRPEVKQSVKMLLSGINRSSASSEWLKDLFIKSNYDAMVNYESVIIETNREIVKAGQEPLCVVYPEDGLVIADYMLGYVSHGDPQKEDSFNKLEGFLLSDDVQQKILASGRRTGVAGLDANKMPSDVFNINWGIDPNKVLTPIRIPSAEVIFAALNMYQSELRKPSFLVIALDFSGSMASNTGENQVKEAMRLLLNADAAKQYMLQPSPDDIVVVIPFNDKIIATWKAGKGGSDSFDSLLNKIIALHANGETDIYSPAIEGIKILGKENLDGYIPAVVLMTDGKSNTGRSYRDFEAAFKAVNKDIPVFAIMFGDASSEQLQPMADLTRGLVFDGRKSLVDAFKKVRGYM